MVIFLKALDYVPSWLWAVVVAVLIAVVGADSLHVGALQLQVANANTQVATLQVAIQAGNARAAQQADDLSQAVLKAQNEAKTREAALRSAADSARSESDGLRNDLDASRMQYDKLSRDALAQRAATEDGILAKCAARYQQLAERTDRHVSDLKTLVEAWPRSLPTHAP